MAINARPKAPRDTQAAVRDEIARPRADESKRLNVPVPPDLYRQIKRQAVDEDRSIAEITRELWSNYLNAQ